MSSQVESALRTLFRRVDCVPCPATNPPCPKCGPGERCSLSSKSCTSCPTTKCVKNDPAPAPAPVSASGGGTNAGAIAGGVIGAVVVIALLTFLIWRFCLKGRRHVYEEDDWSEEEPNDTSTEKDSDFHARRDARASTHTVGSIASTALTRASNVIQIAYIPGVTNRSPPSTPGQLVPPVPPLPFSSDSNSTASTPNYHQDQHFFMPDLRGSTYSGVSDQRSTMARDSVTPSLARSSVATTIYRNNAIVEPMPAQQVIRGKAAVVSVKSSGPSSPSESRSTTPPLPVMDTEKLRKQGLITEEDQPSRLAPAQQPDDIYRPPPSPAFSVGSTFLNSTANTAKAAVARPVNVRKPSKPNMAGENKASSSTGGLPRALSTATSASAVSGHSRARRHERTSSLLDDLSSDSEEDEQPGARARRSLAGDDDDHDDGVNSPVTVIEDTPALGPSPFSDANAAPPSPGPPPRHPARTSSSNLAAPQQQQQQQQPEAISSSSQPAGPGANHRTAESLSAVIEQATRRASRHPTHGGLGSRNRSSGPFSDANEMR